MRDWWQQPVSVAQQCSDAIEGVARLARKRSDPRVENALRAIAANPTDEKTALEVKESTLDWLMLTRTFKRALRHEGPFPECPGARAAGAILLGHTYDPVSERPYPVGLSKREVTEGMLISGRSGSGKTTLILNMMTQLMKLGIPFWAFDFKRDYRHLLRQYPDLLVFNLENYQYNPLRAPRGTAPERWLQIFCDIFCSVFFPGTSSASKNLLLETVHEQYDEHGVFAGSDSYPTIKKLNDRFDPEARRGKVSSQDLQRIYTCRNKTQALMKVLGSALRHDPGFPLEMLLDHNVVFELDGLTREYQRFFLETKLFQVFSHRMGAGQRGGLRHVLVFDEAKMVYASDQATASSHITQLTSMAREYGMGLVVADQMPSSLGEAIKANVFATVSLNLASIKDIGAMAQTLGLDAAQRQYLMSMPVGHAVARFADRCPRPFPLRVPEFNMLKDVSDAEVADHMRPVLERFASDATRHRVESPAPRPAPAPRFLPVVATPTDGGLSEAAQRLALDVRDRPYVPAAQRYRALGMSARQGVGAAQELLAGGFVREVSIATGARGRPGKFLEITDGGRERFGPQELGPGRGGLAHRFLQHRIQARFERLGYRASVEAFVDGKAVDVGVWQADRRLAIEVAMSPAHEVENVSKDLEAGWDHVTVAYVNEAVARRIARDIEAALEERLYRGRVDFVPAKTLLD